MQLGKADSCEGVGSESQIAGICVRLFFFSLLNEFQHFEFRQVLNVFDIAYRTHFVMFQNDNRTMKTCPSIYPSYLSCNDHWKLEPRPADYGSKSGMHPE